jgi:hypothetical protein
MGKTGAPRIYTTGSPSPQIPISAICCIQSCVFSSIKLYVYDNDGIYNSGENQELYVNVATEVETVGSVTFPAGFIIRGNIYSFTLDSGSIIVYPA